MKKYLMFLAFLLIFGTSISYAQNNEDPFTALWRAIEKLEKRLDNIQLIPGPTGPQGETGPPGPQGAMGPKLIVKDANHNIIGFVLDKFESKYRYDSDLISIWDNNIRSFVNVNLVTSDIEYSEQQSYLIGFQYESLDCSGQPLARYAYPYQIYISVNGNYENWRYFRVASLDRVRNNVIVRSAWGTGSQVCYSHEEVLDSVGEVEETIPPVYLGPIEIVLE